MLVNFVDTFFKGDFLLIILLKNPYSFTYFIETLWFYIKTLVVLFCVLWPLYFYFIQRTHVVFKVPYCVHCCPKDPLDAWIHFIAKDSCTLVSPFFVDKEVTVRKKKEGF